MPHKPIRWTELGSSNLWADSETDIGCQP